MRFLIVESLIILYCICFHFLLIFIIIFKSFFLAYNMK